MEATIPLQYRLTAATALHRGDRLYQQDQVCVLSHPREAGHVLAVVADGMGGKSGGRKASDQVIFTAKQSFESYSPQYEDPRTYLHKLITEAHLMIKLTAMAFEEEPHSTIAAFLISPDRSAVIAHVGDSRVYWFRQGQLGFRTIDHSYVQHMIDEGMITEEQAQGHPQANLVTGCLGTQQDPPITVHLIDSLEVGDVLLACSDGLWQYFSPDELAAATHTMAPREAVEALVTQARHRARGAGDNLSIALVRVEQQS
jgi:PPM family protein phosphatase